MMILMLDETIAIAAQQGISEAVLGMAHRGRLNVLAHVLRRPYASILAEFEGGPARDVEELARDGTGDVKYHHGARDPRHRVEIATAGPTRRSSSSLMPNPSHLEFVNPVVDGPRARARRPTARRPRPTTTARARSPSHPRRRGLPRPGHRRGDAEPAALRGYPSAARCT